MATVTPLGIKRVCPSCSVRFYDLNKNPAECPKCNARFDPNALIKTRRKKVVVPAGEGDVLLQHMAKATPGKAKAAKSPRDAADFEDLDAAPEADIEELEALDDIEDLEELEDIEEKEDESDIVLEEDDVVDPLIDSIEDDEDAEEEEEEKPIRPKPKAKKR